MDLIEKDSPCVRAGEHLRIAPTRKETHNPIKRRAESSRPTEHGNESTTLPPSSMVPPPLAVGKLSDGYKG